ncbi:hypothetical protein RHGRI_025959 [Rhododendron griersonianum]|uniref:C2H2-type domain-containing protein n=1 Tax=Rhododendron griersonianum TaxID=479676 RepID=A0AAV6IR45_9ERIC|nr:hypothetical protein RHGRI_025959 [Rhododendron griersonianum]
MAENLINTGPILAEGDESSAQGGDATIEVLQAVRDGQNQMIAAMAALTEAITAALPVAPVVPPVIPPPPPAAAAAAANPLQNPLQTPLQNPLQNPVQNPQNPQTGGPAPLMAHAASPSEVSWTLSFDGAAGGAHGGAGIVLQSDEGEREYLSYKCAACQKFGNLVHAPSVELHSVRAPYPFHTWAMDLIGPIHPTSRGS